MLFETEKHIDFNLTYLLLLYNSIKLHIGYYKYKFFPLLLHTETSKFLNISKPHFPACFFPWFFFFFQLFPTPGRRLGSRISMCFICGFPDPPISMPFWIPPPTTFVV